MAASNHLIDKCDQKIRQVKKSNNGTSNPEEKLKQLGLWSFCVVSSNGWSELHLANSKFQTHCKIPLKFSAVQL